MNGGKPTPGPWALDQSSQISCISASGVDGEHIDICYLTLPNHKANARLMVAAPDLLAALRLTKRMIDEALPKFNWGASALDANALMLLNETPSAVNAAISKAEGGAK